MADLVKGVITTGVLLGIIGFFVAQWYKQGTEFKKDIYDKVSRKVDKTDCSEFRAAEERRLKEHREEGHGRK